MKVNYSVLSIPVIIFIADTMHLVRMLDVHRQVTGMFWLALKANVMIPH